MKKEFDLLVFIGRFQPFHIEHKKVIDTALAKAERVLVLVGSAGKPRTVRNPFTFEERKLFIRESFNLAPWEQQRLIIKPLYDKMYNDAAWINQVQHAVKENILDTINNDGFRNVGLADVRIGLIGAAKDHTSYYLKMFPQFDSVDVNIGYFMSATDIREDYFKTGHIDTEAVPYRVTKFLCEFEKTADYQQLKAEQLFVEDYRKQWAVAPYPVKHVTVDAVVEQSGHVLVVKRRAAPGKGLLAIPGGHLEEYERLEDGVLRELREETKIRVPEPVLRGSIVSRKMYDDPHRSNIGRVVTYAVHIKLKDDVTLPKVKGSDDAEKAFWLPVGEVRENMFFDDHYHIICDMLAL